MPRTELEPRFFVRATDNWVRLAARFVVPLRTARAIEDDLTRRALTRYEEARIEIASATVEATLRFTDGQPPAWASGGEHPATGKQRAEGSPDGHRGSDR